MYALIVKDENGKEVVSHVANYADDTVHVNFLLVNGVKAII